MQLRLAQLEDLSDILPIYESAIQLLAEQGSTQWQDGYGPTKENIQVNILNQELYLLINDSQIVALGTLQAGVDPVYSAMFGGMDAIIGAYQALRPGTNGLMECLLVFNMPFTFVKGLLVSVLCFLIYKPLSPILHGRR